MLRTSEQVRQYLEREKNKRLKKQQEEKERKLKIKAAEALLKRKHRQHLARQEKEAQKEKERHLEPLPRTIIIYTNRFIERFIDDDDVYQSIDELKQAEERGEGKIQWNNWDRLVKQTKNDIWRILH